MYGLLIAFHFLGAQVGGYIGPDDFATHEQCVQYGREVTDALSGVIKADSALINCVKLGDAA